MKKLYDTSQDWVHYLTRPFSLFGASLWHGWYSSGQIKRILGANTPDTLFIEEHLGVVRRYKIKEQLEAVTNKIKELIVNEPSFCIRLSQKGVILNKKAQVILKRGPSYFKNLKSAIDFYTDVALHSTVIPNWIRIYLDELKIENKKLQGLAEKLRAISYYPKLLKNIVGPVAEKELVRHGVNNPRKSLEVLTLSEIWNEKIDKARERIEAHKNNQKFIYQVLNHIESVHFIDKEEITKIIMKLEGISKDVLLTELNGQTACLGKVKGIARIALTNNPKGILFNKGNILVSIQSNPDLMPLIRKCSAMVIDEGGAGCHAAIISREFKIPCIMGTKIATQVLKDGDFVEVDANKGIVKILKRAKK